VLPTNVIETLTALRSAAEDGFRNVFFLTHKPWQQNWIEVTRPQTVGRQTHRDIVTAGTTRVLMSFFGKQSTFHSWKISLLSDLEGQFGGLQKIEKK